MKRLAAALLFVTLPAALSAARAQESASKRQGETSAAEALAAKRRGEAAGRRRLEELMSAVGLRVDAPSGGDGARAYREVRIRWGSPADAASAASDEARPEVSEATLVGVSLRAGSLPRVRSLELSPEHLLAVAVGADAGVRWWSLIPDPRVLRSEWPGPDGQLTGRVVRLPETEFAVNVPEDAGAAELRFYQPHRTGDGYRLVLVGAVALRKD